MPVAGDRAAFEQLVAATAHRHLSTVEIAAALEGQTLYHVDPDLRGLDELAEVLACRFADGDLDLEGGSGTWSGHLRTSRWFTRLRSGARPTTESVPAAAWTRPGGRSGRSDGRLLRCVPALGAGAAGH
jgi:hypothetical protein